MDIRSAMSAMSAEEALFLKNARAEIERLMPDEFRALPAAERQRIVERKVAELRKFMMEQAAQRGMKASRSIDEIQARFRPRDGDLYKYDRWEFDPRFEKLLLAAHEYLEVCAKASSSRRESAGVCSSARGDSNERGEAASGKFNRVNARSFAAFCAEKKVEGLEEVIPGVYRFPMLEAKFSERLLRECDYFSAWCSKSSLTVTRPNSMNNYGAILDHFGFHEALQDLMVLAVQPLASILYASDNEVDNVSQELDEHHGFLVSYEIGKDKKLDFHTDDAEVTLNVCLGHEFQGGDLFFGGVRCGTHQQTQWSKAEQANVAHKKGFALLHRGRHRHAATPIALGRRENLILWCRSSAYRDANHECKNARCPPWCGFGRCSAQVGQLERQPQKVKSGPSSQETARSAASKKQSPKKQSPRREREAS